MSSGRLTFHVAAPANFKRRYQELLSQDYSAISFERAVELVRAVIEGGRQRLLFDWEEARPRARSAPYKIPPAGSDYLKEFLVRTNDDLEPEVPDSVPDTTKWERLAFEAAVFLTFQSRVHVEGATSLLRDAQSVLFFSTIHAALPKLQSTRRDDAHAFLLHAALAHARLLWTDEPAHQNYMLSALYEYVGDRSATRRMLIAALDNTPVTAHDYLTKIQALWSQLIESGDVGQARDLILVSYRTALPEQLDELAELLDETYTVARRASSTG